MPIYLCKPRSPWQRGTNENTNRLLRQYLPKIADLRQFSQADLEAASRRSPKNSTTAPARSTDTAVPQRYTLTTSTAVTHSRLEFEALLDNRIQSPRSGRVSSGRAGRRFSSQNPYSRK